MPTLICQENFDSVTPPTNPTDFTFGTGTDWTTSTTQFQSSPNALKHTRGSNGSDIGYCNTAQDGNSGNAYTQGYLYLGASDAVNTCVRLQSPVPITGLSCYKANVSTFNGVRLFKTVIGTDTQLGSTVGSSGLTPAGGWYLVIIQANGTTITVQVQRQSDSLWLQSNGTWAASPVNCISVTDSSVSGQGYGGWLSTSNSSGINYMDGFQLWSLASGAHLVYPYLKSQAPLTAILEAV